MNISNSIGTRLNCIIVALLLVTCVAITSVNNYEAKQSLEKQLSEDLLPAKIDSIIRVMEQELIVPAAGLGVAVSDPFFRQWIEDGEDPSGEERLFTFLRNIAQQFNTQGCNFVSNLSKKYYDLSSSKRNVRTLSAQDRWFDAFGSSGNHVGINVYVDDPNFGSTAFINRRIDRNGEYLGIISTALPLADFISKVTSMTIGTKGVTYMVDKDGLLRLHPNKSLINKTRLSDIKGYEKESGTMLSKKEHLFKYTDEEGEAWYVMSRFIPELGWYLVTKTNEAELFSDLTEALYITIGIAILLVLMGVAVGFFFVRNITRALNKCVGYAEKIAAGDLDIHPETDRKDEIGRLQAAVGNMVHKLSGVVMAVQSAAGEVADGGSELTDSSNSLSQGATEQAASVEEVSSSMEEMSSNIQHNAQNARTTETAASKAAEDIAEGAAVVSEAVEAMQSIAERITIIEDIARQTNLLALNAAIEAARAGEHGKGFAVVAAEVRKLAERSGVAAGEIVELSEASTTTASRAGEMLQRIVPEIRRTAELVQEISSASAEQSSGSELINNAIQELDKVIQHTASSSEEIAATSNVLKDKSTHLSEAIAYFRLGHGAAATMRPSSRNLSVARPARQPLPPTQPTAPASSCVALEMDDETDFERF